MITPAYINDHLLPFIYYFIMLRATFVDDYELSHPLRKCHPFGVTSVGPYFSMHSRVTHVTFSSFESTGSTFL